MNRWLSLAVQTAVLAAIVVPLAALSDWPLYRQIASQSAVIKLSFTHGSNRQAECRQRTAQELAKLPANMRKPLECPRTRNPVYVELDIDGHSIYRASLTPSGLSKDGPSRTYQRFTVDAGPHAVSVRMRDTARSTGFDYEKTESIVLAVDQNFVVDFRAEQGGFVFR